MPANLRDRIRAFLPEKGSHVPAAEAQRLLAEALDLLREAAAGLDIAAGYPIEPWRNFPGVPGLMLNDPVGHWPVRAEEFERDEKGNPVEWKGTLEGHAPVFVHHYGDHMTGCHEGHHWSRAKAYNAADEPFTIIGCSRCLLFQVYRGWWED